MKPGDAPRTQVRLDRHRVRARHWVRARHRVRARHWVEVMKGYG